jgi:chemotaxis protein methyltransferase CheR
VDNKSLFQAWFRKRLGFDVDGEVYAKLLTLLGKRSQWPNATYETAVNFWKKQCEKENVFKQLVKLVVNNESYFFREPFCFCFFQAEIMRHFSESARPFSVLSVGCSAGQEIYSCAIQAFKIFGQDFAGKVLLFGADIDETILQKARDGIFTDWDMRGLSPAEIITHFVKEGNNSVISPFIRERVEFFPHNILDDWPSGRPAAFEFVFCRNLLVHIAPGMRKDCLSKLKEVVKPGGVLVLAAAEIVSLQAEGFTQMEHDGFFYLKRDSSKGCSTKVEGVKTAPSGVMSSKSSLVSDSLSKIYRDTIKPLPVLKSDSGSLLRPQENVPRGLKESATAYTEAVAKMKKAVIRNGFSAPNIPSVTKVHSEPPIRSKTTNSGNIQLSAGTAVTADLQFERNIQTCFEKYSNGEIQEALSYCEMCLKLASTFSPEAEGAFLVIKGLCYKALGNIQAATRAFYRSVFLLPLSWTANYFLGECQSATEEGEEAAKSFARAYKCLICTNVPLVDVLFLEDLPRDSMKSVCLSRLESLDRRYLVQERK